MEKKNEDVGQVAADKIAEPFFKTTNKNELYVSGKYCFTDKNEAFFHGKSHKKEVYTCERPIISTKV